MATGWGSVQGNINAYIDPINDIYRKVYGRDATQAEINTVFPIIDQDKVGYQTALSFVQQQKNNEDNAPDKVYARQQAEYREKAKEHYGSIDNLFNQYLGRTATQEEKDHFGALLASGQVDAYTVGNYLQNLPENVRKQDEEFRKSLSTELQGQDERYFNESILPSIQSQFAQQGRDVRSSGFASSLAQAATQQNRQREQFLSNLSAQQYKGNRSAAREDYLNNLSRQYGLEDYSRQRASQLQDQSTNRLYEIQNFNMQKQAYEDYLRRYGKRNSGLGSMIGGLVGLGAGALTKNPQWASVGYNAGSGFGSFFG